MSEMPFAELPNNAERLLQQHEFNKAVVRPGLWRDSSINYQEHLDQARQTAAENIAALSPAEHAAALQTIVAKASHGY